MLKFLAVAIFLVRAQTMFSKCLLNLGFLLMNTSYSGLNINFSSPRSVSLSDLRFHTHLQVFFSVTSCFKVDRILLTSLAFALHSCCLQPIRCHYALALVQYLPNWFAFL